MIIEGKRYKAVQKSGCDGCAFDLNLRLCDMARMKEPCSHLNREDFLPIVWVQEDLRDAIKRAKNDHRKNSV